MKNKYWWVSTIRNFCSVIVVNNYISYFVNYFSDLPSVFVNYFNKNDKTKTFLIILGNDLNYINGNILFFLF